MIEIGNSDQNADWVKLINGGKKKEQDIAAHQLALNILSTQGQTKTDNGKHHDSRR